MAADSPDGAVITSDLETELSRALGELGIGKVDHDTTAILTRRPAEAGPRRGGGGDIDVTAIRRHRGRR
jgi:hypothetical protein